MSNNSVNRYYKYDTLRFLLIFLVIIGHEMELFLNGRVVYLYKIIYTFHVPALMFITGKFAKFDKKRILKHLCFPYIVFQALYLWFAAVFISNSEISFQFTTPYWILWYLLAAIFCYSIIPFLPSKTSGYAVGVVIGSFVLAILAGYEITIGYYLSLSRFIVFLPFFLCGYYQTTIVRVINEKIIIKTPVVVLLSFLIIFAGEFYIIRSDVPTGLLYGSTGYEMCGSFAMTRAIVQITALAWIVLLCSIIPNAKIPFVSALGTNTMSVFVLHGFVIRILGKHDFFHFTQVWNLFAAGMIVIVLFVCLGNPVVAKIFKKIF